ncbi:MAG: flavin reductase family protein [Thermoplasmatota archaeon]
MDPKIRREALKLLDYNLALIGTRARDVKDEAKDLNAFVGSWIAQASFEPALLSIAVRADSASAGMIDASGVFTVNLLSGDQRGVAARFLKPLEVAEGKMGGLAYTRGRTGAPVFPELAANLECEVRHMWKGGDHVLFVGEVIEAAVRREAGPTLRQSATGWQYSR